MSITLGGVSLPDAVVVDEFSTPGVVATATRTAGGGVNVQEFAIVSGEPLVLAGGEDFAWISRATLVALRALADVPNATYTLSYEGTSFSVRFANESPPAISATPILPRPNHSGTDYYNNLRIALMRI